MGISVIIPVYNVEQYLVDCLDSVVNQTTPFEQIIIINDGSTDGSLEICKRYQTRYQSIEVVDKQNEGQGIARNLGLAMAKSEYVMFLDSDDYLRSDAVENVMHDMQTNRLDVLYFDSEIKNELVDVKKKNVYDRVNKLSKDCMSGVEYFKMVYPHSFVVQPCMACYRNEYLKENQITFPDIRKHEDVFFSFKAMIDAKRVKYSLYKLYVRRYREESVMTSKVSLTTWGYHCEAYRMCWGYLFARERMLNEIGIELTAAFLLRTLSELDSAYEKLGYEKKEDAYHTLIKRFACYWNADWSIPDNRFTFYVAKIITSFFLRMEQELDILKQYLNNQKLEEIRLKAKNEYIMSLQEILEKIPFKNKELAVGIYGTGNHTEQLLVWYKYLFGEIDCTLFFLDTKIETNTKMYYDRPIINIREAKNYIDFIVISSYDYEADMLRLIRELYGCSIPVMQFYDEKKEFLFLNGYEFLDEETNKIG